MIIKCLNCKKDFDFELTSTNDEVPFTCFKCNKKLIDKFLKEYKSINVQSNGHPKLNVTINIK